MKALIVTTQYVNNYGAVLQAYGMHCLMQQEGMEHAFLKQIPGDAHVFQPILPLERAALHRLVSNLKKLPYVGSLKRRIASFEDFRKRYLPETRLFHSQKEVVQDAEVYDLYITGGDQMFNRSCLNRPVNLLEFGPKEAVRISYSTSMGAASFSEDEEKRFLKSLSRYQTVSLREPAHAEKLQKQLPVPVRCDLDGSFLIEAEEWAKVGEFDAKRFPQEYILVYELLHNDQLAKAVDAAREKYQRPVVVITADAAVTCHADVIVRDAGPALFVGLFQHAKAVVTTSFHGTCFSIIFRKPFMTLVRSNEQRIPTMLDEYGLKEHYTVAFEKWPEEPVTFEQAAACIARKREQSKVYLRSYWHE